MWYHPTAFGLGKRDVIAAWLVCLMVIAACFGTPMLAAALDSSGATRHAAAGCEPVG